MQSGDVACPFGTKHLEYAGADDARGCTTCSCGDPAAIKCGGAIDDYAAAGCAGSYTTVGLLIAGGATCQSVSGGSGLSIKYAPSTSGGSCAATGGAATGSAAATGPTTFCCL
ncbi:MAG: hypothetical protein ACRELB_25175 [Polyangiaceae bacterium]